MQTGELFDRTAESSAVVIHSMPGLGHYNPIGLVHGGYAAIRSTSSGLRPSRFKLPLRPARQDPRSPNRRGVEALHDTGAIASLSITVERPRTVKRSVSSTSFMACPGKYRAVETMCAMRAIYSFLRIAIPSPVAAFTARSLPSTVRAKKNAAPCRDEPGPRYETQRGRNTDGEEDFQAVIPSGLRRFFR